MLGRENACSPVFICRQAPLWLMLSATIDLITQMSSMHEPMCGNSSLTSIPDCPCFWNLNGDWSRLPVRVLTSLGMAKGNGLPLSCLRRDLGSKVSIWLGPPDMNKKITRLARAANGGGLTAKGS